MSAVLGSTVLGFPVTPALVDACRAFWAGVAPAEAWCELDRLFAAAQLVCDECFEPIDRDVAGLVLGPMCPICDHPIESGGWDCGDGWAHDGCALLCVVCRYPIRGPRRETEDGWAHNGCAAVGQLSVFALLAPRADTGAT